MSIMINIADEIRKIIDNSDLLDEEIHEPAIKLTISWLISIKNINTPFKKYIELCHNDDYISCISNIFMDTEYYCKYTVDLVPCIRYNYWYDPYNIPIYIIALMVYVKECKKIKKIDVCADLDKLNKEGPATYCEISDCFDEDIGDFIENTTTYIFNNNEINQILLNIRSVYQVNLYNRLLRIVAQYQANNSCKTQRIKNCSIQ